MLIPTCLPHLAVVAEALSDDRAKDAYGDALVSLPPIKDFASIFLLSMRRICLSEFWGWHLQGMVFSPIPFQPDTLPPIREPPAAEQQESTENVPTASLTSTISEFFKRMIFPPLNVSWITVSEILYSNVPQVSFHPKRLAHLHHSVCQCSIFYLSDNIGIYAWIC